MGRRRQERKQQRTTFGHGGNAVRYQMREKMVSIGDDFWIKNDQGDKVYKVDGKALRVRNTLIIEDANGNKLVQIQERKLRVKDSMEIDDANGNRVAMVQKAVITPVRNRFSIQIEDGPDLDIKGNIVDHEYSIEDNGHMVAQVSKKWFRVRDTYGVEIEPGQNDVVILAATVCLDQMAN